MACSRCHTKGNGLAQALIECNGCRAVLYCSVKCQQEDHDDPDTQYSHVKWCQKFLDYMTKEAVLCDFPFTFVKETTSRYFSQNNLKQFLLNYGVYNQGLWRRVGEERKGKPFIKYGDMPDDGQGYVLEGAVPELNDSTISSSPPAAALGDWAGYYIWRGLSLDSPVAHLMSYPLTVYYIIMTCLREDDPDTFKSFMEADSPHILLVGVEKEVELVSLFQELLHLLPHQKIHIDMVGKNISKKAHGRHVEQEGLSVQVHRSYYHEWAGEKANIIIGFNAGIAAYTSWQPTIKKIQDERTPAYFTEYCEYFVDITDRTLRDAHSGEVTRGRINPFRSPFRITSDDNYLPWFSNCVIFTVTKS